MLVFAIARSSLVTYRVGELDDPIEAIFSFPIFATAIWLLWVLVRQTSSDVLILILGGLLLLVLGIWLSESKNRFLNY